MDSWPLPSVILNAMSVTPLISTCRVWLSCGDIPSEVTRGVIAGREKLESELALTVGGLLVVESSSGVYQGDGCSGDAADGGIEDGTVNGAG
jgi:hypothetical protein